MLRDNIYFLDPAIPAVEIPTRDKSGDDRSNRQEAVNSSCFPFGWKLAESRVAEENDAARMEGSVEDVGESSGPLKNQNFTVAPVQVHYTSPNLENVRKIIQDGRCRAGEVDRSPGKFFFFKTFFKDHIVVCEFT